MEKLSDRIKDFPTEQLIDWLCLSCVDVRASHSDELAQEDINKIREAVTVRLAALEDKLRIKQNHIRLRDSYIEELEERTESAEEKLAERDALATEAVLKDWVACSPEWIERNGACSCEAAPRVAFGNIGPHYHPHPFAQANEDYASLKAERDALATENLALKSFIEDECYTLGEGLKYDGLLHAATRSMPINPATDAYANQLRAEGVEIFAAQKMAEAEKYDSNLSREISIAAKVFAANLRKENGHD